MTKKLKQFLPIIILIGIVFAIYAFNLNNRLFWDDDDWIINNNSVHNISWDNIKFWFSENVLAGVGLKSNYYRPMLFFTFAVNYAISGIKPWSWHLLSNFLHIANGLMIFYLFSRFGAGRVAAFLTALVFLVHPIATEAVTYISGRGDPLYVFFGLAALLAFIKSQSPGSGALAYRLTSYLALVLALLSREVAIIFPLLLIVAYIAFISKDRFWMSLKKGFVKSLPYLAIVVAYGVLRLTVLNFDNTLNFYGTQNIYSENLHVRLLTFMHVLADYVRLLVWPTGLHMERSMTVHTSLFQWPVWPVFLILLGLIGWLIFLYRKGKNTDFKVWFFGVAWFFIALAPVSGITPINAILYEHWLYLPLIGPWFIAAFYLVRLLNFLKLRNKTFLLIPCLLLLVAYLSFFAYQSIRRNILWGKPVEFFEDILKYEPNSARVNNNLGNLYFNQGDIEKAETSYRKTIAAGDIFAQPHYNIGSILQSRGDVEGAIEEFERAIAVDPNFTYSYQNIAVLYVKKGNLVKAVEYLEQLKKLLPQYSRVYYNLALLYVARGDSKSALDNLSKGLTFANADPEAKTLIERLLSELTKK